MYDHKNGANRNRLLMPSDLSRRDVLRGAVVAGAGVAGASMLGAWPSAAKADTPKRGGNLRVAMLGGNNADTVDAHGTITQPDTGRVMQLYNCIASINNDGKVTNVLAESIEPNAAATEWTIRLKKGIKFHDGKALKAEDVAFTFRRIADPKNPLVGAPAFQAADLANMKIMDDLTLRVPMKMPYAAFPETISAPVYFGIVPVGYDPKKPVGTGPFKFQSFTPGQQSVFTRFDEYWQEGMPYLDSVTLIDFADATAAFNALQGGQVDVFAYAPVSLAQMATQSGSIKPLISRPGQWTPFTMRVDTAPFNNPDVRMAMRLLVDRQQMINLAFGGLAEVAHDVFARWDHCYDTSLHRERDIDKAKFLLKKAGQENLTVELVTSDIADGVVRAAQVLAQQAKDAGVTINVRNVTPDIFFGDQYLKWPFAQDYWDYSPYLSQVVQGYLPTAAFNETHWGDEGYIKLYHQAQATVDQEKRCEIVRQMQKIDFEQGGYIIVSYNKTLDLLAQNVNGFRPGATGYALGNFEWERAWLA
jgi:peptide/nickel transport system substrate-binding protein